MLPYALMLGMTEEQFWHSNPKLMKPYVKAHELKVEEMDRQAHIQVPNEIKHSNICLQKLPLR